MTFKNNIALVVIGSVLAGAILSMVISQYSIFDYGYDFGKKEEIDASILEGNRIVVALNRFKEKNHTYPKDPGITGSHRVGSNRATSCGR